MKPKSSPGPAQTRYDRFLRVLDDLRALADEVRATEIHLAAVEEERDDVLQELAEATLEIERLTKFKE